MVRGLVIVVGLLALIGLPGPAVAQGPYNPEHSDPYWQAAYWNNMSLSGSPVLERNESNVDYNWGQGSPDPSVHADGFSARWIRYLDLDAGTYRFTTTSDDGIRLSIDGQTIINEWNDHSAKTVSADKALSAGHHLVIVEYYENTVDAVARVSWALATPITKWRGEYYNNTTLSGSPALVRDDAQIQFDWGNGSPANSIHSDYFSARWTRSLALDAGTYRFTVTVDDGARLWVNGHLLIDQWKIQAPHTYSGDIYVAGGNVPVKLEYFENNGIAVAKLSWARQGSTPGTVIVDDLDAGFVKGGDPASWRTESLGYNGHMYWTKNNDTTRYNYNWVRWYADLDARRYEVYVYIPHEYSTTSHARYWISHYDGYTLKVVNQSAYSNQWVSLGTYRFSGTSEDYVSLSDVTYECYLCYLIAFDAVKFVPR
jgi:hypothetical protein